jgi:hypothetical protein
MGSRCELCGARLHAAKGHAAAVVFPAPPVPALGGPTVAIPSHRELNSGGLLGETFSIYFANFVPFLVLTAVALSPLIALAVARLATDASNPMGTLYELLSNLGSLFCAPLATGCLTYGVLQQMRGIETSVGQCLRVGLSAFLPVLGTSLLQGLVVGLGTVLCIVPGIIFAAMYAVAVPAYIEERLGAGRAMSRSASLTDGYRWPVFCVLFVIGCIQVGLERIATMLVGESAPWLVLVTVDLVPTGLSGTAGAVLYYRLRAVKESFDIDQITSVFD